jgi:hypothetical protein
MQYMCTVDHGIYMYATTRLDDMAKMHGASLNQLHSNVLQSSGV